MQKPLDEMVSTVKLFGTKLSLKTINIMTQEKSNISSAFLKSFNLLAIGGGLTWKYKFKNSIVTFIDLKTYRIKGKNQFLINFLKLFFIHLRCGNYKKQILYI